MRAKTEWWTCRENLINVPLSQLLKLPTCAGQMDITAFCEIMIPKLDEEIPHFQLNGQVQ